MLSVNEKESGLVGGPGAKKFRVVLESPDRGEVDSVTAREMAAEVAAQHGFSNAGLSDFASAYPFSTDGAPLDGLAAVSPDTVIVGYRVEYTFANRI